MAVPTLSPGNGYSSAQLNSLPATLPLNDPTQVGVIWDDFYRMNSLATAAAADWRAVGAATIVPPAVVSGAFGRVQIAPTGASASTYGQWAGQSAAAAGSTPTFFTFVPGKEVWFETLFQLSDATAPGALAGLVLPVAADPIAAADGVFFVKAAGSTTVQLKAIKTSASNSVINVATMASATDIKLGFHYNPNADSGNGRIFAYVNGNNVGSVPTTNMPTVGLTPTFGHINDASNRTSNWDYILAAQAR